MNHGLKTKDERRRKMQFKTDYIKVQKTARFSSYGQLNEQTKYFWFCLHGSNMLCEQMLYKFTDFDPNTHYVVAAEGLSRFYAKGMQGDVVASWMTKRDRLHEIDDFSNYLSQLYEQCVEHLPQGCKKIIVAFSQGGTTAYRWMHKKKVEADLFIPYSCWVPEDIDLKASVTKLNDLKTVYTYGTEDQYLREDRVAAVKNIIHKNALNLKIHPYAGKHRIEKKHLQHLLETYI